MLRLTVRDRALLDGVHRPYVWRPGLPDWRFPMSRYAVRARTLAFIALTALTALALQAGQRWFQ
jgi:hypothetical protein